VRACAAAEGIVGPLRTATIDSLAAIDDDVLRARARHVVTENERVRAFARAIRERDDEAAGAVMDASHASLRDDYEVSTASLDRCVAALRARPGVLGARLTGAGFGGCVVALARPGALRDIGWVVRAVSGATVTDR
jgi:galactokinase